MNSSNPSAPATTPFRIGGIVFGSILVGFGLVVVGVSSYFRLSPETAILRESALSCVNGGWNKTIALNAGFFTTSLVRLGSHWFKLPPEPRAAIDSLRGAEVGVYKLHGAGNWVDHGAVLARADKAMSARRWDRVVGVSQKDVLVAVYAPRRGVSSDRIKACVLVLQGNDLVVAGASGNLDPVLELAGKHFEFKNAPRFALR